MGVQVQRERVGARGIYRLTGKSTLGTAVATLALCVQHATEEGLSRVLIDASGLHGFRSPGTLTRFLLGEDLADKATAVMCCALVVSREHIDRERFGTLVARNRGLDVEVFASFAEAEAWLASEPS